MLADIFTPELFASAIRLATPIGLTAIGAAICERSGVVNIALEGFMLMASFAGVATTLLVGNAWIGILAAMLSAMVLAAIHAWASINLRADQVISGTAINILALGLTGYLMETIFGHPGTTEQIPRDVAIGPLFGFLPKATGTGFFARVYNFIDVAFLSFTPLVYVGMFSAVFFTWALFRTKWGLRVRALGEHPRAAGTVGISVLRGRWWAVLFSGAMAGLAGANLAIEQVGSFTEGMTNARGFIALAANIFGRWIPGGGYLASLLFGFADALQLKLQIFSGVFKIPPQFFLMLPYILTVIVLAGAVGKAVAPAAIGKPYKERG
ncbi:MAG: ABC transporter permease [Coriobacteriales bacterium]|nr:ABC transporter permease [Coriobacteriales bacterium]